MRLARSYHLVVPDIIRSITCVDEHEFGMGYLETMRVVRNFGSHWGIVPSDGEGDDGDDQPADQPKPQLKPMRRNVRGRGERRQPMHPPASMVGAPFRSDMAGYFDQLSLSVNWISGTMENVVQRLGVEQPPHLGYHYLICPRWTEYRGHGADGAGTSGVHEDKQDV
ncbi:unnamed protein product [Lactuca saligna]|uniref:Uncharacterized protein n=1 Tax=Lactuca saligna TaxID=75948 RepID=A0AA35ZPD6_LACSI|nr:unnamed protein product [Lactuca saligna]